MSRQNRHSRTMAGPASANPPASRKKASGSRSASPSAKDSRSSKPSTENSWQRALFQQQMKLLERALQQNAKATEALARLAASQARQLDLMIDGRFGNPVITEEGRRQQPSVSMGEPAEFSDVTEFDRNEDHAQITKGARAEAVSEQSLEAEFLAIADEHEAASRRRYLEDHPELEQKPEEVRA